MEITLEELVAEVGWLRGLAGDLAHDAYLIAQAKPPPPDRPRRPWLLRVTRNLARMRARGAARTAAREAAVAELATAPPTPEDLVARLELHRLLAALVLELAPALRDVVLLHYVEGLTSAQIGNRLGLASGTVRWRLKQAVDELRERLEEKQPNRAWVPALLGLRRPAHKAAPVAPAALAVLAVAAAIASVAVQWRAHDRAAAPSELPSSPAARQPHAISPGMAALAYREHDDDNDDGPDWRIRGRVIDESGSPLADARIEIEPMCFYGDDERPEGRSQRDGQFAIEVPPDCSYWVYAEQASRVARFVFPALPAQPVTLVATPNNALVLHAIDAETHAPVRDAHVERTLCWNRDCPVFPEVSGGTVRVTRAHGLEIAAPGYEPAHVDFERSWQVPDTPPPGVEHTIEMYALHHVVGVVLGLDGQPLANARLPFSPVPSGKDIQTDASGQFEAVITARGYLGCTCGACASTAERPGQLVVRLTPQHCSSPAGGTPSPQPARIDTEIAVTVIDAAGRPVRNAEVRTFRNWLRPMVTDARGVVTFHIESGVDDLYARRGSRMSPLVTIEAGGGRRAYTLRLQPAAITGIVVDSDGEPVAKAWLRVRLPFLETPDNFRDRKSVV